MSANSQESSREIEIREARRRKHASNLRGYPQARMNDGRYLKTDIDGLITHGRTPGPKPSEEGIKAAVDWLLTRVKRGRVPNVSSLRCRRAAERWHGGGIEISNGAMIVATEICGFSQSAGRDEWSRCTKIGIWVSDFKKLPEARETATADSEVVS
tara:strand:- start:3073 stop:3540 length:468 start_codon:yes stop_codon:yes gene_type:complete